MIEAIKDGLYRPSMKDEMNTLEDRKEQLVHDIDHADEPPTLLHPSMAEEYKKRIDNLFTALQDNQTRLEAAEDIRSLIGTIIISPNTHDDDRIDLFLNGDLAGILALSGHKKAPAHRGDEQVLLMMVAGVGFEPTTFRL